MRKRVYICVCICICICFKIMPNSHKVAIISIREFEEYENISLNTHANSVSDSGACFVLKNCSPHRVYAGNNYFLQTKRLGLWYTIILLQTDSLVEVSYIANSESALYINWSQNYGKLPTGEYRLIKPITINGNSYFLSCYFEVSGS